MDRRKVIGIGVGLAVLPTWWALRQVTSGTKRDWHTDTAPLERAFPLLGPLTDAKWVSSRDNDRGIPSPELVISGFARLTPGKLAELTAAHAFVSEAAGRWPLLVVREAAQGRGAGESAVGPVARARPRRQRLLHQALVRPSQ